MATSKKKMSNNDELITKLIQAQQATQTQVAQLAQLLAQQAATSNIEQESKGKHQIINQLKEKFEPETTSIEHFIDFFEAKCNILNQKHNMRDLLISCLTPNVYHELKIALTPNFDTQSYDVLKNKLMDLYHTRKTRLKALTEFWNCTRQPTESMERYANRLRQLSKDCGYEGELLEIQLRDRFATGINHAELQVEMRQKWPDLKDNNDKEVTFANVFKMCAARELAENEEIPQPLPTNKIRDKQGPSTSQTARRLRPNQCRRCGKTDKHPSSTCTAKNHKCNACGTEGHFESCCIKSGNAYLTPIRRDDYQQRKNKNRLQHVSRYTDNSVATSTTTSDSESSVDREAVNKINKHPTRCKKIDVHINGQRCTMDWDPGSVYSIISTQLWKRIGAPALTKGPKLHAYCNFKLKPKGLTDVEVELRGIVKILPVVVMKDAEPMLFGLQWSEMFGMIFPEPVYSIKHPTTAKANTSLQQILHRHEHLFDNELGKVKNYQVNIHVKQNAEPKHLPARPVKFSMKKNIERELDRLVTEGIISPIDPNLTPIEWATPTVNVLKKDGRVRICGDYRITINPALIAHSHPVPVFDQLRQRLANGDKYSKIDLKDAYLQFEIAPDSKKFLVINTHKGYFEYNRMPFGITTAPSIFQRFLEKLLDGLENVAVYFDDIAVTGRNDVEHLSTLAEVFQRLEAAGLKVNLKKCTFLENEIEYLGHILDKNGVRPTSSKIDSISKAPPPTNAKELRSFLGLVNFYERFIPHLHSVCADLHTLTAKNSRWKWSDKENMTFQRTKELIAQSQPLVPFQENRPVFLACDASEKGVGAVLYHINTKGIEQPIAFASRKLRPAETKYSVIDREALAIFFGTRKFDQYLRGTKFTLVTDHKPLIHILGPQRNLPKVVNNRLVRWALIIGSYDFDIRHTKGESNIMADYCSRMPNPDVQPTKKELAICKIVDHLRESNIKDLCLSEESIKKATKKDPILREVYQRLKTGWKATEPSEIKPYYRKRQELSLEEKMIMWEGRIVMPHALREATLKYLHLGHPGTTAMRALARFYVWWPSLDEDVDAFVKRCHTCQENRPNHAELPVFSWSIPDKVWERLHIDFAGPFEGKYWLVLCDALSKWIEVRPMETITTSRLTAELDTIFCTFGLPEIIVSDNGPQFTSHEFQEYCSHKCITHITSAPYHPRTNGLAERLVRTFKTRMLASKKDKQTQKQKLQNFLFTYRITPHSSTGKSPGEMMFGRRLSCVLSNVRPNAKRHLQKRQIEANIMTDQETPIYPAGTPVFMKTPLDKTWSPATIDHRTNRYSYVVTTADGNKKRSHADHLRLRVGGEEETNLGRSGTPVAATATTRREEAEHETLVTPPPSTPLYTADRGTHTAAGPLTPVLGPGPQTTEATPPATEGPRTPVRPKRTIRPPRRLIEEM